MTPNNQLQKVTNPLHGNSQALMVLVDEPQSIVRRRDEMISGTWSALLNGKRGVYQRAKRAINTYYDTHLTKGTFGLDATEKVAGLAIGIGIAVLGSGLIAASIGSFGAVPISMVVGIITAIIVKKIFDAVRAYKAKNLAMSTIALMPDATIDKVENAVALLKELYKDIPKIDRLVERYIHYTLKPIDVRAKTTNDQIHRQEFSKKLNELKSMNLRQYFLLGSYSKQLNEVKIWKNLRESREYIETDPNKIAIEIGSRLKRVDLYCKWLEAYCEALKKASADMTSGDELLKVEAKVLEMVAAQVSAWGNHGKCSKSDCYQPAMDDPKRKSLGSLGLGWEALNKINQKFRQQLKGVKHQPTLHSEVEYENEDNEANELLEDIALDRFVDQSQDLVISNTIGKIVENHIAQIGFREEILETNWWHGTIGDHSHAQFLHHVIGTAGGAAAFAPVGWAIGQAVSAVLEIRKAGKTHKSISALRKFMSESDDKNEIEEQFAGLMKATKPAEIQTILAKAAHHYPGRIKKRFQKLQRHLTKCGNRKQPQDGLSLLANCTEAQTLIRYLLKVHHNAGKQLVYTAILQVWVKGLHKRAFHEGA